MNFQALIIKNLIKDFKNILSALYIFKFNIITIIKILKIYY